MTEPTGPYDFVYVHTDIPEGITIREWRAERAARAPQHRDVQRRARRKRPPAMLVRALRRIVGGLGFRAPVGALTGRW